MTQNTILLDWTGKPVNTMPQNITPGASAFILDDQARLLLQMRSEYVLCFMQ
jgi:hypothetical protein